MAYMGLGQSDVSDAMDNLTGLFSSTVTTLTSGVNSAELTGLSSQFNWEDWALVGIGGLVLFEILGRGARSVSSGVSKRTGKVKRSTKKRRAAARSALSSLGTVFTG